MNRAWLVVCAAAVACLGAGPARALEADLGIFGSYLDTDDLKEAYGAGAKLKFALVDFLAVEARGSYLQFDESDIEIIPAEGVVVLNLALGDTLVVYGGAGGGYYFFEHDDIELEDAVGYFPVAGAELNLGDRAKLFGEVRWLFLQADVDAAVDELEDAVDGDEADMDGLGINIGLAASL